MDTLIETLRTWLASYDLMSIVSFYIMKIFWAVIIFAVGRWFARLFTNMVQKFLRARKVDTTLVSFGSHLIYVGLILFVVLAALNQLGIQTTSFIAIIGAAGLAIGLALQGSLSNFAAGVLMIFFRPFKVGDYIEGAGVAGMVKDLQIFTTLLTTPDNKLVIIPNASLTGGNIINYSVTGTRRVDLVEIGRASCRERV